MKHPSTIAARVRAQYKIEEAKDVPHLARLLGNRRWWNYYKNGRSGGGASVKAAVLDSVEWAVVRDMRDVRRAAILLRNIGFQVIPPSKVQS